MMKKFPHNRHPCNRPTLCLLYLGAGNDICLNWYGARSDLKYFKEDNEKLKARSGNFIRAWIEVEDQRPQEVPPSEEGGGGT